MTRLENTLIDAREQSAKLIRKIRESKTGKKVEEQDHKKISKEAKDSRSPHGTLKTKNQELTGIIQQHGGE